MTAVYQATIYKHMVYQLAICLSCFTRFCEDVRNVIPSSKVIITKLELWCVSLCFNKQEIDSKIMTNILIG